MTKLTLGFSPCPNDTFIFDAMIHGKIDTEGLEFDVVLADVEELNSKAFRKELTITKLSYHALVYCTEDYQLLSSGSALGSGVGPLLITTAQNLNKNIDQLKIAIPGTYTTANFLLSIAYPSAINKVNVLFSDIERMVLEKEVDAGLIIHENRFTYAEKGLKKIIDLGEYWEKISGQLIPLGGIVVKRNLTQELKNKINRVLKKSVQFAFAHPQASKQYVRQHAQELSEGITAKHIDLYVNQYSIDLGKKGKQAVVNFIDIARKKELVKNIKEPIFVENTQL